MRSVFVSSVFAAVSLAARLGQVADAVPTDQAYQLKQNEFAENMDHWYGMFLRPLLEAQLSETYQETLTRVQEQNGYFEFDCEEGDECFREKELLAKQAATQRWRDFMSNFKAEVKSGMDKTQEVVNRGWANAVECVEQNLCCATTIEEWENINTTTKEWIERLKRKENQLALIKIKIQEMIDECPDVDFDAFVDPVADDLDCEWKYFNESCDAFAGLSGQDCILHGSYSPCIYDYWFCEIAITNADGTVTKEDCTSYLNEPESWSMVRADPYWTTHPEYQDLFQFFDEKHGLAEQTAPVADIQVEIEVQDPVVVEETVTEEAAAPVVVQEVQVTAAQVEVEAEELPKCIKGEAVMFAPEVEGADSSYWTCTYLDDFEADYEFPQNPSYGDFLDFVFESQVDTGFDFSFGGQATETMNEEMESPSPFAHKVNDSVRRIDVWYSEDASGSQIVKSLGGYDEEGEAVFESENFHGANDQNTTLHQVFLEEGDRIVGIRADTSNSVKGRTGFWRNVQFLIASHSD